MTYVPPTRPSIRVERTSPYKGGTHTWGNRFFFTGSDFTSAQFDALVALLKTALKSFLPTSSSITECTGYDIGSDVPVFLDTTTTAGTYALSTYKWMPLESAALWRFTTDQRSAKNHPIYGFKYMHCVANNTGTDYEALLPGLKSTMEGILSDMLAGYNDGSTVRHFCDARGAVFQSGIVRAEVTHRDFPNL